MPKKKTAIIRLQVELDEEGMPIDISWQSNDNPEGRKPRSAKGMLLALFDNKNRDTFKIDLWTRDMQVAEMDRFMYQSLRSMADTYYRATSNGELANEMQRFVQYFGERIEIFPKGETDENPPL